MIVKHHRIPTSHISSRGNISTSPFSSNPHLRTLGLDIRETALKAHQAGISVVPVLPDGTKHPSVRWRVYQQRLATNGEIARWFAGEELGLALVTGAISGGLEALDFDSRAIYEAWSEQLRQSGFEVLHDRLASGYLEATPNGLHLLYRSCPVARNQKLASMPVDDQQLFRALIETRGEGGLVLVAPSSGGVHPSGKPYVLLAGGITTIATITPEERQALFTVARAFDQTPPKYLPSPMRQQIRSPWTKRQRPGDRYNRHASWEEVLEPHGWRVLYTCDGKGYWQRPGKEGPGISATTNYRGTDMLYVFSTSTPFETGRAYSKFAAFAILEHGGDFSAAARVLAERGGPEKDTVRG